MRFLPVLAAALAATLALFPPRPDNVERFYSRGIYPALQRPLTALSNLTSVTLFDVFLIVFTTWLIVVWVKSIRDARRKKSWMLIVRGVSTTLTILSGIYLWFVLAWGLNYARPPLESKLAFDAARVTPAAVR